MRNEYICNFKSLYLQTLSQSDGSRYETDIAENFYNNIWSLEILKEAFTVILSHVCKNVCKSFICGFSTFKQHSVSKYNWQIDLKYMVGGCAPFQFLEWHQKRGDNISGMTIVSIRL